MMAEDSQAQQVEKKGASSISAQFQQEGVEVLPSSFPPAQASSPLDQNQASFSATSGFVTLLPICLAETKMFTHTKTTTPTSSPSTPVHAYDSP